MEVHFTSILFKIILNNPPIYISTPEGFPKLLYFVKNYFNIFIKSFKIFNTFYKFLFYLLFLRFLYDY